MTKQAKASTATTANVKALAASRKAKASPVIGNADVIATAGNDYIVGQTGERIKVSISLMSLNPMLRELAKVGGSMAAVRQWILEKNAGAKLANGLTGRNAPNCGAALQDAKAKLAKGKATPQVPALKGMAPLGIKPKAAKADKPAKAPKVTADDTRKLVIVDKKFTFGGEGTSRRAAWNATTKAKTVADYIAAGGARKYLARWEKAGAIKLG